VAGSSSPSPTRAWTRLKLDTPGSRLSSTVFEWPGRVTPEELAKARKTPFRAGFVHTRRDHAWGRAEGACITYDMCHASLAENQQRPGDTCGWAGDGRRMSVGPRARVSRFPAKRGGGGDHREAPPRRRGGGGAVRRTESAAVGAGACAVGQPQWGRLPASGISHDGAQKPTPLTPVRFPAVQRRRRLVQRPPARCDRSTTSSRVVSVTPLPSRCWRDLWTRRARRGCPIWWRSSSPGPLNSPRRRAKSRRRLKGVGGFAGGVLGRNDFLDDLGRRGLSDEAGPRVFDLLGDVTLHATFPARRAPSWRRPRARAVRASALQLSQAGHRWRSGSSGKEDLRSQPPNGRSATRREELCGRHPR